MRNIDILVGHWGAKEEPQTTDNVCRFSVEGSCKIFGEKCDGCDRKKGKCSFFKTEEEYKMANDAAIRRCRALGLCKNCKYRPEKKCQLSDEPETKKGVRND